MEIKLCKLVDGSIVIGKQYGATSDGEICDIVDVIPQQTENGIGIALAPVMFPFNRSFTGKHVHFSKVLICDDAPKELADRYVMETSGIIPAQTIPESIKKSSGLTLVK